MTAYTLVPDKWDYEADVLVVGAGTAGFPAAIAVADAGDKVAILELLPQTAPSLALINVGPAFAGTPEQKEQGIDDSPHQYFLDGTEMAKGDPGLWKAFTDNQLETYEWGKTIGIDWGKELQPVPK